VADDESSHEREGPIAFGKYLLDEEIARGGMARVHLARLRGLGGFEKKLVVKQILPHLAADPRFVSMFVDEAKTLVALSHPHVVPVYELGVENGIYFLAMEHVDGATLADMILGGPLAPAEAAHVGVQVADALSYAEERFGLVHRDVTPRNVMVESSGHARLLDFGIAARADDDVGKGLYGTPGFLSPEQARGEKVSGRSDLFSLACVLFEAVHARPLFPARGALEAARTFTDDDVARLVPGSDPLSVILRQCLAPHAEDRPESARVLGRMLRAVSASADDPASVLGRRAEQAMREVAAKKRSASRAEHDRELRTPGSGARSATLATSELLGALIQPAPDGAAAEGGTAPIQRPWIVVTPTSDAAIADGPRTERIRPAAPKPASTAEAIETSEPGASWPSEPSAPAIDPPRRSLGWAPAVGLSAVLAITAGYLAANAERDPMTPDTSRIDTDTDGTMSIPPEDAGADALTDARPEEDASEPADVGPPDAGADAGESRVRTGSNLRVTSDGSLTVRVDGRVVGHAPIRALSLSPGDHRLTFECDFLGRSAEENLHFDAGASLRVRVTCNTNPPRVVIGR
jgi:serine/threonine-protein kinase